VAHAVKHLPCSMKSRVQIPEWQKKIKIEVSALSSFPV
jgi:hypothetical protein